MNITELARKLNISPQELREAINEMGFSVGQKAIKVDNNTAEKIMRKWPEYKRKKEKEEQERLRQKELEEQENQPDKTQVEIPKYIAVKEFANLANVPIKTVLTELMKNGVFVSMNEKIDFDTASIIGAELGLEVSYKQPEDETIEEEDKQHKVKEVLDTEKDKEMETRAPVIVVMGHVDHGKTKLLDSIRKSKVTEEESGGITQHIGAYQIQRKENWITFIDTPGHEAFTAMRSRGAQVADVAILVVAADDGVKPQTVEAYKLIEKSNIPFLIAINKIDKPEADINRVKQEISNKLNVVPEDWGGKTICAPISAINQEGIDHLLDMVLLVSDTENQELKANPQGKGLGTIIESHIDKAAGPLATILMQNGSLKVGDHLSLDGVLYGKVKALFNHKGESIKQAGPSVPAQILGFKLAPKVGDILEVGKGKKMKTKKIKFESNKGYQENIASSSENKDDKVKTLNLIIKSDVLGSAEAIEESLMKINGEKVKIKVLNKSLGNINENDVKRAADSDAQILAFNVKAESEIKKLIREKGIKFKEFSIIYNLIEYVKEEMEKIVEPDIVRKDLGRLKVLKVFKTENKKQILGGKVIQGTIKRDASIELIRDKEVINTGKLLNLKIGQEDVNTVEEGQECGIEYQGTSKVQEGDILNFYKEEEQINKI